MIGELFVASSFQFLEEFQGTVSYSFPFIQCCPWIFGLKTFLHKGCEVFVAIISWKSLREEIFTGI